MKKIFTALFIMLMFCLENQAQDKIFLHNADSLIVAALERIDPDTLRSSVQDLQDMGTRFMLAPNRKEVATWIMDQFTSLGIAEVRLDSFISHVSINYPPLIYDTTTWQYNVEARIEGEEFPDDEIVLLGHYDAVIQTGDPMITAPGADDNASGTAALLECARVIQRMEYKPQQTIIFLASAAEELMYFGDSGTEHYAAEAQAAGRNIVMVINNDMIAWNDGSWTVDLFNHALSLHITALAIDIIEIYTSLNYYSSTPVMDVGGDIQPFHDAGYCGIYFMEHLINPNYHKETDLVDNCDFSYLAEVTKISLGLMLHSDITVGLDQTERRAELISVYPNPARERVNVNLPAIEREWNLKIYDTSGRLFYEGSFAGGSQHFDISGLHDGIYVLTFNSGEDSFYQKLAIGK